MKSIFRTLVRSFPLAGAGSLLCLLNFTACAQDAPVRVGIVGLVHGHVGGFISSAEQSKDIVIVGIVEADTQLAGEYRRRFRLPEKLFYRDLEGMLKAERPRAVATFTTTFDHRAVVEACSRRGVHVMMEKPLAVSLADARSIRDAAAAAHIQILVNYWTTWSGSMTELYRAVRRKGFGEIRKMVAHAGHRGPKEIGVGPEFLSWLTDPVLNGGGALMDFGCYGANLITWLMENQRPLTVTAVTQQIKPAIYPKVDDEATIILTYPHAQGIIQASWNWPFDRNDLEVYGTSGTARTVGSDLVRLRVGTGAEEELKARPPDPPADDPIHYLAAVVRGKESVSGPSSLENNMIVCEILDAARRSAATGRTVDLMP
jgi:predicted dehydrogenase